MWKLQGRLEAGDTQCRQDAGAPCFCLPRSQKLRLVLQFPEARVGLRALRPIGGGIMEQAFVFFQSFVCSPEILQRIRARQPCVPQFRIGIGEVYLVRERKIPLLFLYQQERQIDFSLFVIRLR